VVNPAVGPATASPVCTDDPFRELSSMGLTCADAMLTHPRGTVVENCAAVIVGYSVSMLCPASCDACAPTPVTLAEPNRASGPQTDGGEVAVNSTAVAPLAAVINCEAEDLAWRDLAFSVEAQLDNWAWLVNQSTEHLAWNSTETPLCFVAKGFNRKTQAGFDGRGR
jgi:hypothetical protein